MKKIITLVFLLSQFLWVFAQENKPGTGTIEFISKKFNKGNIIGGLIFGFGWAITGACPGPLFALIGNGATVIIVTLFSAIAGTWVYGYMRDKLPH